MNGWRTMVQWCGTGMILAAVWLVGCSAGGGGGGRTATNQNDNAVTNDNGGTAANDNGSSGGGADVTAPDTLGGAVNVRTLTIPAGHTTRVTSDLTVTASGQVTIEGSLIADASTGVGTSITIDAQGDVDIGGTVQSGDGTVPAAARRKPTGGLTAQTDDDESVTTGLNGVCGGSVDLKSARRLSVRASATVQTGNGSDGQDGFPNSRGGCGGNLFLRAGTTLSVRGSLIVGNGGNGGLAVTTVADLPPDGYFSNDGGRSGVPFFQAPTLDIPGLRSVRNDIHALDPVAYSSSTGSLISGGVGGSAGGVIVTDNPSDLPSLPGAPVAEPAAPDHGLPGLSQGDGNSNDNSAGAPCPAGVHCLTAGSGGWGWSAGGIGGTISISIGFDRTGLDGTSWSSTAGSGGDVDEDIILIAPVVDAVILDGAQAGPGGDATAAAPSGGLGDASHRNGGNGGTAYAYAGRGGNGSLYGQQTGGRGGQALVYAGTGGWGFDDGCAPGAGGNGGDGFAYGGNGGDGTTAGEWGSATALYGEGGPGGNGSPEAGSGAGGLGGLLHAEGGCFGADDPNITAQPCGPVDEHRAPNGEAGSEPNCCNCG